jgi:uncharacterized membrane protein
MLGDGTIRGLTVASLVGSGIVGGVFFAFSTFVMRGLEDLRSAEGIRAMQAINVHAPSTGLGAAMTVTLLLAIAMIVLALADRSAGGAVWRLGGGIAYVASFAVTPAFNIPRNDALDRLDPESAGAAAQWATYVHEWTIGNHVRGGLAILACAALAISLAVD